MSTILNDIADRIAKARGMWAFGNLYTEIEAAPLVPEDKATLQNMVATRVAQQSSLEHELNVQTSDLEYARKRAAHHGMKLAI